MTLVFALATHGEPTLIGAETARRIATLKPAPRSTCPARPVPPNDRDNAALEHPHRLELGIDALATRLLVEPIPVAIDPVGDRAYTPGRTTSTPANRPLGG